jgi:pimeloyl-ACP methyl ester carboxylesterase
VKSLRRLQTALFALFVAAMTSASSAGVVPSPIVGKWHGNLHIVGGTFALELSIEQHADGTLSGELESVDQAPGKLIPLSALDFQNGHLAFGIASIAARFDGMFDPQRNVFTGTWTQAAQQLPLTFTRGPVTRDATSSVSGVLTVPEDRTRPGGRAIDIHYVVIPATTRTAKSPVFLIAGGPGQSIIKIGPSSIPGLVPDHDRDIVMVDQRGTGESHPLECDLFPTQADTFRAIYPLDIIAACRSTLAATSDLRAYGTDAAADDLNDIRLHLGYRKIVIAGASYGTTVALDYMRRHGESVAAAILDGVAPPGPLSMARGAQAALDDLERRCKAETACSTAFPHFGADFQSLLLQARHGGIKVSGGVITSDVLVERMRDALYSEAVAAYIPMIVHRAVEGDPQPLAQLVSMLSHEIPGSLATGMFLSVTCPEDVAFTTLGDVAEDSANTFLGDARFREAQAACRVWNVKPVDRSFLDPIRSDVPVLMISGEDDPATPPRYGAEALRYLPNGRQVIVPHAGHFTGSNCVDTIKRQFLDTYDVRSLDITCLKAAQHPPFVTN